ncbi:hypothetical protein [Microvirga pudoricolor]|uniref:hypothetical protein n=1 Tax=Microvirga pudoricolor TaxID=2778729 RepID=UPI0019511EF6|nr:hypothetical protein [Microvirga pudoricolor]MBM6593807.1 hypothetical protein [Microvirga pudoricolor]
MKHRMSGTILAGAVALLACGAASAAPAAKSKAASGDAREACKAEVAAAHPPGSLSRKRSPRDALIAECMERRAGATR